LLAMMLIKSNTEPSSKIFSTERVMSNKVVARLI